jgi:mono/diheme cytochrome c family protein
MLQKTLILLLLLFNYKLAYLQTVNKVFPEKVKTMTNPQACDAKTIAAAAKIYKKVCWTCHGDNGNGLGPGAKEIKTKVASFSNPIVVGRTDGELFWWITTGGNDMQPFKDVLSKGETWSMVCYIRKVQNK